MKLSGNEYRVACDWSMVLDYRNKALREKTPIRIGNVTLYPASDMCEEQFVIMSLVSFNAGTFIVPDNVIDAEQSEASISAYIAVGDYCAATTSRKKATDEWLNALASDILNSQQVNAELTVGTKIAIRESNNGLAMMVSFLVVYMGVVFMLASAAILSLKTLSDTVDSVERFQILRKLGCDRAMMKKALSIQVGSFFLAPVVIALIHSIFGIRFAGVLLKGVLRTDLKVGILMTFVFMALFYGSYMIAAMRSSKRIVNLDKET